MKKLLLVLTLLLASSSMGLFAQMGDQVQNYRLQVLNDHVKRSGGLTEFSYLDQPYNGTPYNNPSFLLGTIYSENSVVADNYALRYNAHSDEIEVKESLNSDDSKIQALTKSPDIYVKIMNKEMFVFAPYNDVTGREGYFQVLYVGENVNLYKKVIKRYYPAKEATNSFEHDVPASFVDKPVYYLVDQDGTFHEFSKSKRKKFKTFGDKMSVVKKFAYKAKLDLNEEKDLVRALRYYDSLQ